MSFENIFKKMKSQSGRTMTEMIGIIAIIGVLSLTGLLGYNYAMEMVRENETLNRASKIIAGARTSYILQTHGDATEFYQPGDTLPSGAQIGDRRDKFEPQPINMHDVISNIGNDFAPDATYIVAPLKGPIKDGTEENVKIYVRVETPLAFTVRFDNLTKQACMKIVMAQNLGYWWAFEDEDGKAHWLDPTLVMNEANAEALCDRVIGVEPSRTASAHDLFLNNPFVKQAWAQSSSKGGTLVLWFGPYSSIDGEEGEYPLCAGNDCCCEIDEDGNKSPVGKAGCKKPPYGNCVACTYENSDGYCIQKDGGKCSADDVCHVSKCNSLQFECGDTCCAKGQTCTDGKCKGDPDPGVCLDGQTRCGDNCCDEGEICNSDGLCETDLCPANEGKFWCVQDEVCCDANQKCQNGECVTACPNDEVSCGDECCPSGQECKESCGYYYCVPKCPAGETLYCSHDYNLTPVNEGKLNELKEKCDTVSSCCDEWQCTQAPLILKDPNPEPTRKLEVPINKTGKYAYCAVEANGRCGLVTYCDEEPIKIDGKVLEICPTCFDDTWHNKGDYDTMEMVCVDKDMAEVAKISDGKEGLVLLMEPENCINNCENPCPNGGTPTAGGGCCPEGQGWGACGHCGGWATYTDACGRVYPVADICCQGQTSAPPGCTGLGNGTCYENYPIQNRTQCCALACASEQDDRNNVHPADGQCCDPKDASNGVCCESDSPITANCCTFKGREWCLPDNMPDSEGQCCKDDETCDTNTGECTSAEAKKCEEAGGVPGYKDKNGVPAGSEVKDKDGNIIGEGDCCAKEMACPKECCAANEGKHCAELKKG